MKKFLSMSRPWHWRTFGHQDHQPQSLVPAGPHTAREKEGHRRPQAAAGIGDIAVGHPKRSHKQGYGMASFLLTWGLPRHYPGLPAHPLTRGGGVGIWPTQTQNFTHPIQKVSKIFWGPSRDFSGDPPGVGILAQNRKSYAWVTLVSERT